MTHFLILASQSLVVDGLSFRVFLTDLQQHYKTVPQEAERLQFIEYTTRQHLQYETKRFDKELKFSNNEFSDFPDPLPILSLGKVSTRPALTSHENERADLRFTFDMKDRIQALCRRFGVTPFHFHLAVFRVLLARYSGAKDFSIVI
jgi:hybrid polyketide synthase / nonribosomal peptide synthetase ACE1